MEYFIHKLFIKQEKVETNIFADNLFISIDSHSSLRSDYLKTLEYMKKFDEVTILKSRKKELQEQYSEQNYILEAKNNNDILYFFARLVIINGKELSDVLVYTLGSNQNMDQTKVNMDYYDSIFLKTNTLEFSESFIKEFARTNQIRVAFVLEEKHLKLIYKTNDFLKVLGYEDWDFENKFQNYLEFLLNDDSYYEIVKNLNSDNKEIHLTIEFNKHIKKAIKLSVILSEYLENQEKKYFLTIN